MLSGIDFLEPCSPTKPKQINEDAGMSFFVAVNKASISEIGKLTALLAFNSPKDILFKDF